MRISSPARPLRRCAARLRRPAGLVEQARWLFFLMTVVSIALGGAGAAVTQGGGPLPLAVASAGVMLAVTCHRYLSGRAPWPTGIVEALALGGLAAASPVPSMAYSCLFSGCWLRAITGTTRGVVRDGLLLCAGLAAGLLLWPLVPGHIGRVDAVSMLGGLPSAALTVAVARYLALGLLARERTDLRDVAVARLGQQLVGVTDEQRAFELAWSASERICEASPGLRLLIAHQDGDRLCVLRYCGDFASAPGEELAVRIEPDLDGDAGAVLDPEALDAASGAQGHWTALRLPSGATEWLVVGTRKGRDADALVALRSLRNQVSLVGQSIRAHRDLERQASTDALTGLANRSAFTRALRDAASSREPYAVLFLDLDDFKVINDGMGHAVGDEVLVQVAVRLLATVRRGDLCARLGGDEFAVLLHEGSTDAVEAVGHRLVARIGEPVQLGLHRARVGASIGAALAVPGADAGLTVQQADAAMYAAKAAGKNRVQVVTAGATPRDARAQFEDELARASGSGQLVVHYQPIVAVAHGACVGVEAFVRWRHPTRGLLDPADFLDVAVRTSAIVEIGAWVLRQACTDADRWGPHHRGLGIHVNVSVLQLRAPDFVGLVAACLRENDLEPSRLTLETSGAAMTDGDDVRATLLQLRALGVRLAIDDVGTGASLLTAVRAVRPDVLKLNRSFSAVITDPGERAVMEAVVAMAARLGIAASACGVQSEDQQAILAEAGVQTMQGAAYLPAVAAADLESWLAGRDAQGLASNVSTSAPLMEASSTCTV